jgi:ketosteroid isomerase-like protein
LLGAASNQYGITGGGWPRLSTAKPSGCPILGVYARVGFLTCPVVSDFRPDAKEFFIKKNRYAVFEALNPFFEIVLRGLSGLVDGEHYFDTFADDAIFESRYHFPGWPVTIRERANLMASLSGYGKTIKLHSSDALVVHRTQNSRVVILEYEVHGEILSSGARYDNRLISVVTIENRKIVHWRDYMDSLAAWTALNSS